MQVLFPFPFEGKCVNFLLFKGVPSIIACFWSNRTTLLMLGVCKSTMEILTLSPWFVWLTTVNIDMLKHSQYSSREHIHAINLRRQSGFLSSLNIFAVACAAVTTASSRETEWRRWKPLLYCAFCCLLGFSAVHLQKQTSFSNTRIRLGHVPWCVLIKPVKLTVAAHRPTCVTVVLLYRASEFACIVTKWRVRC